MAQSLLWVAHALAQAKKNESRLAGEVLRGNEIIKLYESRIETQNAEIARLRDELDRHKVPASDG